MASEAILHTTVNDYFLGFLIVNFIYLKGREWGRKMDVSHPLVHSANGWQQARNSIPVPSWVAGIRVFEPWPAASASWDLQRLEPVPWCGCGPLKLWFELLCQIPTPIWQFPWVFPVVWSLDNKHVTVSFGQRSKFSFIWILSRVLFLLHTLKMKDWIPLSAWNY